MSISAIAAALAQGRTDDQISIMAAAFTQLGDTLSTISAARSACETATARSQAQNKSQEQSSEQAQANDQEQVKPPV